jgi:protein-L-isoaspartate(D-aspartate) O-methyltransferase
MAVDSSAAARSNMVESQVRTNDVTDPRIQDAMRVIDRAAFAAEGKAYLAYADTEVPYGAGRWLLKPRDVAKLLQALRPQPGERALAIAAPYAAAVLEALGLTVDRLDDEALKPVAGGYQVVVSEGAVARVPAEWLAALDGNGRLGAVERDGPVGKAVIYVSAEDGVGRRPVFDATPPVMAGFAAQHGFAF